MPNFRVDHVEIAGQRVEIRRSPKRHRSIEARWEGGGLVVLAPARLRVSPTPDPAIVDLVRRVLRKGASRRNDLDLMAMGRTLSQRFLPGAPQPSSVRWVANMNSRWASCSPQDGSIRMSDKLRGMPQYVIEAVLLHELAHLIERGHGPAFQALVRRNPQHDVAEAYLAGASFGARQTPGELPTTGLDSDESSTQGGE